MRMNSIRLFVAIDFPKELKTTISQIIPIENGFRKPLPEQIHLTLKFIGNVPYASKSTIIELLKEIHQPAFPLTIQGAGCFVHKKIPQVLWISIINSSMLQALKNNIDQALESLGFKKENREFVPHITISRLKNISLEKIKSWLDQHRNFQYPAIMINEFYLFSSQLSQEGAIYTKETEFLLK